MNRATFLPSPCDPYISLLWLRLFPRWQDEIDKLYVYFNTSIEKPVAEYVMDEYKKNPKIEVIYVDHMTQHGSALVEMTKLCQEDLVMWIEDDGFIFKPGFVDECFKRIESNNADMVGSPRMSSSMDLQKAAAKVLNVDMTKHGDVGVGIWPNFFFCKRKDLLRTDMDFNAHKWDRGELIKPINWICTPDGDAPDIRADTFVWGSIQMRALGLKLFEIPQYHMTIHFENEEREHKNLWDPQCRYTHAGSLSGSIYGLLTDEEGVPLMVRTFVAAANQKKAPGWKLPKHANSEDEKKEFEKRCAFYILGLELNDNISELEDFRILYVNAVERVILQYSLDRGRIYALKESIKRRFEL